MAMQMICSIIDVGCFDVAVAGRHAVLNPTLMKRPCFGRGPQFGSGFDGYRATFCICDLLTDPAALEKFTFCSSGLARILAAAWHMLKFRLHFKTNQDQDRPKPTRIKTGQIDRNGLHGAAVLCIQSGMHPVQQGAI